MQRLADFHEAFGVQRWIDANAEERHQMLNLRLRLITEEYQEVVTEIDLGRDGKGDIYALAKELADLLVVVYGTAEVLEIPLHAVFNEVMNSNMSKLQDDGTPLRREDGKILKGPNYREADVEQIMTWWAA